MSGVKDVFKNGWHPDKGTTLKQQVSGVFSRGDDSSHRSASHNVTPLSQLRDPSSFAPPPRRSIAPPPPPSSRPTASPAPSQPPPVPARSGSGYGGGSGTPISPSPLATGSSGPPRLPPRLPPRPASGSPSPGASPSGVIAPPPPLPPSQSPPVLNQGAIGRLGAAGISVPGLGIGSGSRTSPSQDSPASSSSPSQFGGLQARFAKLGTSSLPSAAGSTQPQPQPPPPSEGTTFAQKQAALKTAADFHKDPRSVSLSDARAAASTMNNFRQRHGDQVAAGLKTANGLNQKYGVTDKVATYSQQQQQGAADPSTAAGPQQGGPSPGLGGSLASAGVLAAGALAKKRPPPPPPPPKRKPDVGRSTVVDDEPPPIPHATRPTF